MLRQAELTVIVIDVYLSHVLVSRRPVLNYYSANSGQRSKTFFKVLSIITTIWITELFIFPTCCRDGSETGGWGECHPGTCSAHEEWHQWHCL